MSNFNVEDVLARAEALLYDEQFEACFQFYEKALESAKASDDLQNVVNVLESYAFASVEGGNPTKAIEIYTELTTGANDKYKTALVSAESWLSLAQLQDGFDALDSYRDGIERLQTKLNRIQLGAEKSDEDDIRERISSAYCSLSELYLTDLCYEEDAEKLCENYLLKAKEMCPESVEVSQLLGSLYMSKNQTDVAKRYICQTAKALIDMEEEDFMDINYEFRVTTTRFLLELGQTTPALEILVRLVNENDSIVEPWLLLATGYKSIKEVDAVTESVNKARFLLEHYLKVEEYSNSAIFKEQSERLSELEEWLHFEQNKN